MKFIRDPEVPRLDITGIPAAWSRDDMISADLKRFLMLLISMLPDGVKIPGSSMNVLRDPFGPPLSDVVLELTRAGYLKVLSDRSGEPLYELVHPERLAPLEATR